MTGVALRPAAGSPRPLRVLPVPATGPEPLRLPFPVPLAVPVGQGALALQLDPVADPEPDPAFGPQRTGTGDLPDAEATCATLARAVVEVLAGSRPPAQLVRWLSADVHAGLVRRAAHAARLREGAVPLHRAVTVRRVRVCHPAPGTVEAAVVVVTRERVRAVAVRLEGLDGRWRATAVEVG